MALALNLLMAILVPAIPFLLGLALFRGADRFKWVGVVLMALGSLLFIIWISAIPVPARPPTLPFSYTLCDESPSKMLGLFLDFNFPGA